MLTTSLERRLFMSTPNFSRLVTELKEKNQEELKGGRILTERDPPVGVPPQSFPALMLLLLTADVAHRTAENSFVRTLFLPPDQVHRLGSTHIATAFADMRTLWDDSGIEYLVVAGMYPTWVPRDPRTIRRMNIASGGPAFDRPFWDVGGMVIGSGYTGIFPDPENRTFHSGTPSGPLFLRGALFRFAPNTIFRARERFKLSWMHLSQHSVRAVSATHRPCGVVFGFFRT
ncbi:MAG: hypothetical protein KBD15_03280 [Candidatus Magasanikbacteria bacterium]|nr:hypothetical protein [Candidatus Magasanikbacteria bacterium]